MGRRGGALAIPVGIACGVALGLVNGVGVAYLRVPSMIFTLGVNAVAQGLMVVHTGGFCAAGPQRRRRCTCIATGRSLLGMPERAAGLGRRSAAATMFLLHAHDTSAARSTPSATASARPTCRASTRGASRWLCFVIAGACFGVRPACCSPATRRKAYQAMGDAYLLPAIAAVVLGGTTSSAAAATTSAPSSASILITLLQSILSVMQIPEFGRQVIYGVVIIVMLLLYGRGRRHSE